MPRWHNPKEHTIMFRRWKFEMEQHGYDWRCPPTDPKACHCAKGIGSMRKQKPARSCHCSWCFPEKFERGRHNKKLVAIRLGLDELFD